MNFRYRVFSMLSFLVLASALGSAAQAQQTPPPSVPVRVTVTVAAKEGAKEAPAEVTKDDVLVIQRTKERLPVTEWARAQGDKAGLQLAIVIDEGVGSSLGNQLSDIKEFINGLGPQARVGVFYAQNGSVSVASQFTEDHMAAAKAVRLPLGRVAAYSSIYFSLDDLMRGWPSTSDRREILLVADGFDYLNGPYSVYPDSTVEHAQKNGIVIHAIYSAEIGRVRRNLFLLNIGQSNLAKLADGTGGESYFQGNFTPIAFQPYLNELTKVLNQQYWLTFLAKPEKKSKLQPVKITTEINGVEISAPEMVYVPGNGEKMKN